MTKDAPERIWAFYTPDDFDDDATITAYETVQHGGQQYVRADRIEKLEAEMAKLRSLLTEAAEDLTVYAEAEYPDRLRAIYPSMARKWKNEMDLVFRIRAAAIAAAPHNQK